jgi:drug/metabolite transporter (DMT)-like permease
MRSAGVVRGGRGERDARAGPNMLVWHVVVIFGVQALSSGRSAILGYTRPIFTALVGVVVYGERLAARQWLGVAAAGVGVLLLLSEEFASSPVHPGPPRRWWAPRR